jgi:fused signal recognition particle receptor
MLAATSWTARLRSGLGALFGRAAVDESLYAALEDALLGADCGVAATRFLLERLRSRARRERIAEPQALKRALQEELRVLLEPLQKPLDLARAQPLVVMIAGVNGSGKTTSIGKLAKWLQAEGKSVLLAAGDTYRAAAREQLVAWGRRNGVAVIAQASGDAAAVVYDAAAAARARGIDVLIADTAGRLPTQLHLMEEIRKVKRVLAKAQPGAPHEVLLVLDANTGQNALAQVKAFDQALGLTGLVLTKLDGTAKGGVVCAIAREHPVPLLFIGVGEGIDDLRPFAAAEFAGALVD